MNKWKKTTIILAGALSALMLGSCRNAREEEYLPGYDANAPRFSVVNGQPVNPDVDAYVLYDTVTRREYIVVNGDGTAVALMPEWDREQTNAKVEMTSGQIHYGWTKNLHFAEEDLHVTETD